MQRTPDLFDLPAGWDIKEHAATLNGNLSNSRRTSSESVSTATCLATEPAPEAAAAAGMQQSVDIEAGLFRRLSRHTEHRRARRVSGG